MYTFKVEDTSCGGCAASIRKRLAVRPGLTASTPIPTPRMWLSMRRLRTPRDNRRRDQRCRIHRDTAVEESVSAVS